MKRTPLRVIRLLPAVILSTIALLNAQNISAPDAGSSAPTGFDIAVRDKATGFAVDSATVRWAKVEPTTSIPEPRMSSSSVNGIGHARLSLTEGDYVIEIAAPGYKAGKTQLGLPAGATLPITAYLEPKALPKELQEVDSKVHPGSDLVYGYAVDSFTHQPISGVHLRLQGRRTEATSNERGYFEFAAPTEPTENATVTMELPTTDILIATANGYKMQIVSIKPVDNSALKMAIDMKPAKP